MAENRSYQLVSELNKKILQNETVILDKLVKTSILRWLSKKKIIVEAQFFSIISAY